MRCCRSSAAVGGLDPRLHQRKGSAVGGRLRMQTRVLRRPVYVWFPVARRLRPTFVRF